MEPIIDNFMKSYLVACLVSGIHVEADPAYFMAGLVDHMNELKDRIYWAVGDEDGVILHDKFDVPVLSLTYNNNTLKFMLFEEDKFLQSGANKDAGLMLLNVLGYIREEGLDCEPMAMRTMTTVVPPFTSHPTDDWSL